jgi:formylglycine-generating enzyme required for sulfatase activity
MLLDFGLAKSSTNVSVRAYTLIYAAPEQITGHGTVPTSDIYSVGATLYHLLSGQEPVDATTRAITKVSGEDPMRPLYEIEQTIPQPLSELVSKAMELDVRKRFLSIGEMRVQFKKVTQELWATHGVKLKGMIYSPKINVSTKTLEDKKTASNKTSNIKIKSLFTSNLGLELVLIPSGSFLMGTENSGSDERPVHEVKISQSFYLSQYLITQGQWEEIMGNNPSYFKGDKRLPIERVSWIDVQEFIKRMNSLGDGTYRLPTEAEWEYAARAGSKEDFAGDLSELGWYANNSGDVIIDASKIYKDANLTLDERYKRLLAIRCRTHIVGSKKPNKWKLYDMHGNVSEWCEDWYDGDYYKVSPAVNPKGPAVGSFRVVRGGSWFSLAEDCRSADRSRFLPTNRSSIVGFRLVREVE